MNRDLWLRPHESEWGKWWWYETPKGIEVIPPNTHDAILTKRPVLLIPWRSIRKALGRKDKR